MITQARTKSRLSDSVPFIMLIGTLDIRGVEVVYMSDAWDRADSDVPFSNVNTVKNAVEMFLVEDILAIKGVERVYVRRDVDAFRIWVFINKKDRDLEKKVYKAYMNKLRGSDWDTDLIVVFRLGRKFEDLIPMDAQEVKCP